MLKYAKLAENQLLQKYWIFNQLHMHPSLRKNYNSRVNVSNRLVIVFLLLALIGQQHGVLCIDRNLKGNREKNGQLHESVIKQAQGDFNVIGQAEEYKNNQKQQLKSREIQVSSPSKQDIHDQDKRQQEIQVKSNSKSNIEEYAKKEMTGQSIIVKQLQKRAKKVKVSGFKQTQAEKSRVAAAVVVNSNIPVYAPTYSVYTQPVGYPYSAYPYTTYNPYYPYQYPATTPYVYPPYYQQSIYQQPVYQPVYQQPIVQQPVVRQPTVQQQPSVLPQDSLTNLVGNLLKTSTTTVSSAGGVTNINITPASTPQALNSQLTNNIINNVFTHLIPKTDPSFYNTGPSEKVYELKNISLNAGSTGISTNTNTNGNTNTPTNITSSAGNGGAGTTASAGATAPTGTTASTGTNTNPVNPTSTTGTIVTPATNTASNVVQPSPLIPTGGTPISLQVGARSLTPSLQFSTTSPVTGTSTSKSTTLADTVLPNTTFIPSPTNATVKLPTVNGTITGSVVSQSAPVNAGTQLKYEQFLLKFKPNLLTNNPSQVSVYRQTVFNLNVNSMQQVNAVPNSTYKVGVNLFADLTQDEFNQNFAKLIVPEAVRSQAQSDINKLKTEGRDIFTVPPAINVDWSCRASSVITQGVCGACFTIAALEAIQITMRMYNRTADSLSVQEVISCGGNNIDNNGCNGGYFTAVFFYAKNQGVGQSPNYFYDDKAKYEGILSECNTTIIRSRAYDKNRVFIKDSTIIRFGDCAEIVNQLKVRSIAVAIAAYGLQFYVGGTYTTTERKINHGVTLVGYDSTKGYLIKNTWGAAWGRYGYGFVDETTGICDYGMYPILLNEPTTPAQTQCNANGESIDIEKFATPSTNQVRGA